VQSNFRDYEQALQLLKEHIELEDSLPRIDGIIGGEARDWIFSLLLLL
jgi:hypothetical protein